MSATKVFLALALLVAVVKACEHNGIIYKPGDSFINDCNRCVCGANGQAGCDRKGCPPKVCEGKYGVGEAYLAPDGCNKCTCSETGVSGCTMKNCVV